MATYLSMAPYDKRVYLSKMSSSFNLNVTRPDLASELDLARIMAWVMGTKVWGDVVDLDKKVQDTFAILESRIVCDLSMFLVIRLFNVLLQ